MVASGGTTARPFVVLDNSLRGKALVPTLVFVGLLVSVVSSLGAPLVPTIAVDYGVSLGLAQWSLTITLLVGAVASPIIGRLGDGPHRPLVLLSSLGVLVAGSFLAALPVKAFVLLLMGRAMQGVGLALLPLAMSVARDHLEPHRARAALATLSVTSVVGIGLGYPATGVIAEHISFHACFWIAGALGLAALSLSAWAVPTSSHHDREPFDGWGALLLGLGLSGLLLSITQGSVWGWGTPRLISLAAASTIVVAAWIVHELRTAQALVNLRLMATRDVLTANVTAVLGGIGMYMMLSMVVRYVQTPTSVSYGLGESVVVAGLVLLPLSTASFLASKGVNVLGRWINQSRLLSIGILTVGLSMALFAVARSQLWLVLIIMAITGAGMGILFAVMPRMIVSSVPASETSSALSLNQVLRTIGYSTGSALAGSVLSAHTRGGQTFPTGSGYTAGASIGAGLCLLTAIVTILLPQRRGRITRFDPDIEAEIELDADVAGSGGGAFVRPEPGDGSGAVR